MRIVEAPEFAEHKTFGKAFPKLLAKTTLGAGAPPNHPALGPRTFWPECPELAGLCL